MQFNDKRLLQLIVIVFSTIKTHTNSIDISYNSYLKQLIYLKFI